MKLSIVSNDTQLGELAAQQAVDFMACAPESCLVFPTGNTPLGMYRELVNAHRNGRVSFKNAALVELDDYFGIPMDDPRNLFAWLKRTFIEQVDFSPEHLYRFITNAADGAAEAGRMAAVVKSFGGIGLVVLGLGPNGHIAFNEPGSSPDSPTRVVELTPASLESNSGYWGKTAQVPSRGITLGMDLLLSAKKVILLVNGKHKAGILRQLVVGGETALLPASFLQRVADFTIIADSSAASLI
jgi:glucosamine-6-phosphate deaminase